MPEPLTFAFALRALEIHLTFASLVALAAWAVTSSPRMSATTKYWIWVATSINFVLPVGVWLDRFWSPRASWLEPLEDLGNDVSASRVAAVTLGVAWVIGLLLMLARMRLRIGNECEAESDSVRTAERGFVAGGVPVRFDERGRPPSVDGLLRPRISLPAGIQRLLTGPELDAVLLHELAHARRRDNLIRLVHEIGLCALWFHPLVWLTGRRLALYRELSCDESVLRGARGRDLVSALAKLANPGEALLLRATASSYLGARVDRLAAFEPPPGGLANGLPAALFYCVVLLAVFGAAAQSNLMSRAAAGEFCSRLGGAPHAGTARATAAVAARVASAAGGARIASKR